jgi:hypothetical protein
MCQNANLVTNIFEAPSLYLFLFLWKNLDDPQKTMQNSLFNDNERNHILFGDFRPLYRWINFVWRIH